MISDKLFYTYEEIADLFGVKVKTVRCWKSQGLFKIVGYKRLGKWAKKAVVDVDQVKLLIRKRLQIPKKLRNVRT